MVSKSIVKAVKLDLQDDHTSNATIASLRPGKGRYHSLLGLLSNTKLRSLQLSNVYLLGTRTSNLPSGFSASWLQRFGFYGRIDEEDQFRLTNVISHCSQLVDLRLANEFRCIMGLSLQQAVLTFKKLRRLHLSGLHIDQDSNLDDPRPMKEIVYYTSLEDVRVLAKTIRQSGPVLEVLVLHSSSSRSSVDIGPEDPSPIQLLGRPEGAPAEPLSNAPHLSALTHLDLSVPLTLLTLNYLSTILPRLNLVHFGFGGDSHELLQHCNIASLKSLSIFVSYYTNLKLLHPIDDGTATPAWDGLEQLYIRNMNLYTKVPTQFLQSTQLTRLYLDDVDSTPLAAALEAINLSKLQEITFNGCYYYPSAERVLAKRINEFTESLVIRLDEFSSTKYVEEGGKPRTAVGSFETLPRHRVINMGSIYTHDHHYGFLQHVLPVYFH